MKLISQERSVLLAYGTNVHPSEDLGRILAFLRGPSAALKARVSSQAPMALGLYLSSSVVEDLSGNEYRRWELDEALQRGGFLVPTLNVFPFGDFHAERVKEKVFEPDWTSAARLDYTKKAADLLARWIPEGGYGSLSTHTGGYGKRAPSDPFWKLVSENFAKAALHLHRLQEKAGKRLMLCLEPEPFSVVEDTTEILAFYEPVLLHHAKAWLFSRWGMTAGEAESLLRRHLGICFDTCHLAVQGEDLLDSLRRLQSAGVPVGKAQLSVALEMSGEGLRGQGLDRLRSFAEPRYFHQTLVTGADGTSRRFADLPEALACEGLREAARLRTHFHVPIYWEGDAELATTRGDLAAVLPALAAASDHLEIETYTWDVLPPAERTRVAASLEDFLEKEYRWVLREMAQRAMFVPPKVPVV